MCTDRQHVRLRSGELADMTLPHQLWRSSHVCEGGPELCCHLVVKVEKCRQRKSVLQVIF